MCTFITKKDPKLVHERNEDGETPLFLAALHGKKGTFYALHKCHKKELHIVHDIIHCKRNVDGNSILHVAILGEYFGMKPYLCSVLLYKPYLCSTFPLFVYRRTREQEES